jgi:hypothetical protein
MHPGKPRTIDNRKLATMASMSMTCPAAEGDGHFSIEIREYWRSVYTGPLGNPCFQNVFLL